MWNATNLNLTGFEVLLKYWYRTNIYTTFDHKEVIWIGSLLIYVRFCVFTGAWKSLLDSLVFWSSEQNSDVQVLYMLLLKSDGHVTPKSKCWTRTGKVQSYPRLEIKPVPYLIYCNLWITLSNWWWFSKISQNQIWPMLPLFDTSQSNQAVAFYQLKTIQ